MRKKIPFLILPLCFAAITALFWYSEWRYSLPTPVPAQYQPVATGQRIVLPAGLGIQKNKPVLLHFFNPACPCSRFNMPYFRELTLLYGDKIDFAVVVLSADKDYTASWIRNKYGLDVPVLFDSSLARICGVYSTPQAVLLGEDSRLYYRGNYNRSRYCTDKKTNYAQAAIDSLLASRAIPVFNKYALTAYGCSLPGCKK